jgi:hypothetical protein
MNETRMPTKGLKGKFSQKTTGKTTADLAGHQEHLIFAAEYKRMEETSKGQGYLEGTTQEASKIE